MDIVIQNQNTCLFTTVYLNPGKETVILLHGGPGVPGGLNFIIQSLQKHFQVIYFHQRGTLKSPCLTPDYSLAAYVSDLNVLANYFKLEKFHLFGHSWGGLYAQVYTQEHPNRLLSLFLACPGPGTGWQWKEAMLEVVKYTKDRCNLPEWLSLHFYSALGLLGSNLAHQKFYQLVLHKFNQGFRVVYPEVFQLDCIKAPAINQTTKNVLLAPTHQNVPQPDFKITVVFGINDIFKESQKYVYQRYPTANIILVPASGHVPWSHNIKDFTPILDAHYSL